MVRRIGSSYSDLGETVLTGVVADQAALYEIISPCAIWSAIDFGEQ